MRQPFAVAFMLAAVPFAAQAGWVAIWSDAGKRIEIDADSLQKEEAGKPVALGRVLFEKELLDTRTSAAYRSIETLTRYDCTLRTVATLKRTWRKDDGELLREEETKTPAEQPVRSGSIDDKLLREVCRPRSPAAATAGAMELAEKANSAAIELRRANEAMIQKEVQRELHKQFPAAPAQAKTAKAAPPAPAPAKAPPPVRRRAPSPPAMPADWGYAGAGGPEHWGRLKPEFALCAKGHRQSPIDLRDGIRVDQPPVDYAWRPSSFGIEDTGRTIRATLLGSSLSLLGKPYQLVEVHFHHPAEEKIEGRGFEMSAHFVHRAADGRLLVVAVPIARGAENPFIQTLWNYLPLERHDIVSPPEVTVDPAQFLPAERAYYTYMGSLTTPPCTENVQWIVLKQPAQASAEQIAIFARLYPDNARPLQAANGRLIKGSR